MREEQETAGQSVVRRSRDCCCGPLSARQSLRWILPLPLPPCNQ